MADANRIHPLRLWRLERNISITDLARDTGVNMMVVSRVERGATQPKFRDIATLCAHTGLSADDFVRWKVEYDGD